MAHFAIRWGAVLSCAVLISSLVGCGQMFVAGLSSNSANQADSSPESLQIQEGAKLYATNCATCHGDLGVSVKRGKSVSQIQSAITTVSAMKMFSSLSASQTEAIAAALNASSTVTLPGGVQLKYQCATPAARGLADTRMHRLIKIELVNTLTDLLGASIVSNTAIQTQFGVISADVMDLSPNDLSASHADAHVSAMLKIGLAAADLSLASTTDRDRIYGACAGVATITDACVQTYIQNFGLRVLRRPVTTTEAADYLAYYKTAPGTEGLKRLMIRFLLNPSLAFHLEVGGTVQNSRVRLTDYEIASRISYRIASTMPDAALFQAASEGKLQSINAVDQHVRRLLASNPLAKAKINDFFRYYLQYNVYNASNPKAAMAAGIDPNGLKEEMMQETADFVNNVVWTKAGKFPELFSSKEVFPRSARLSKILESSMAVGATPALTTAAHAGILLRPSFLASSAERTNPMHRGALIRKRILCDTLGAPDPNAVNSRLNELGDLSELTNRDRYLKITGVSQCLSCHNSINPVGFSLEGYDQLGMRRSTESIFNADGTIAKTKTVDPSVTGAGIEPGGPDKLMDGIALNEAIGNGNKARSCFSLMVFEFQRARVAADTDSCALNDVETTSASTGTILDTFVKGVANEDIFWKGQ